MYANKNKFDHKQSQTVYLGFNQNILKFSKIYSKTSKKKTTTAKL